jgi:hypothetical protein
MKATFVILVVILEFCEFEINFYFNFFSCLLSNFEDLNIFLTVFECLIIFIIFFNFFYIFLKYFYFSIFF